MSAKVIDGKAYSSTLRVQLKNKANTVSSQLHRMIGLAVVIVGNNSASAIYVANKVKACEEVGIKSFAYHLEENTNQKDLLDLIDTLTHDNNIDGILVQLPLPKHLDERTILAAVDPSKDVDGFHAVNAGNMLLGNKCLFACTPNGIIHLIKSTGVDIAGKHAVVVGRSNIVGKPIAMMLLEHNATVTITHSKTKDLPSITKQADILVVAIGQREFVAGSMVKAGAIVIDVGMNRFEGKLYGDVHYESVSKVASHITPVPGGVGPMTITMLLSNTIDAAISRNKL